LLNVKKNDANVSANQQQAFTRANGDSNTEALKSTKRAWLDDVVITLIITLKRQKRENRWLKRWCRFYILQQLSKDFHYIYLLF